MSMVNRQNIGKKCEFICKTAGKAYMPTLVCDQDIGSCDVLEFRS